MTVADYGAIGSQIGGLFGGSGGGIGGTLGSIAGELLIKKPKPPKIIIQNPPVQQNANAGIGQMAPTNPFLVFGSIALGVILVVVLLKKK